MVLLSIFMHVCPQTLDSSHAGGLANWPLLRMSSFQVLAGKGLQAMLNYFFLKVLFEFPAGIPILENPYACFILVMVSANLGLLANLTILLELSPAVLQLILQQLTSQQCSDQWDHHQDPIRSWSRKTQKALYINIDARPTLYKILN